MAVVVVMEREEAARLAASNFRVIIPGRRIIMLGGGTGEGGEGGRAGDATRIGWRGCVRACVRVGLCACGRAREIGWAGGPT